MLEAVIATLDMVRKIEILKERSNYIPQQDWRKPLLKHLERLERISKWRNFACHTVLIPDDKLRAVFVPTAAAKLLKSIRPSESQIVEKTPIAALDPILRLGESALYEGQMLIQNFRLVTEELARRRKGCS